MSDGSIRGPQRPEKIHALTALRFLVALWVVFYHTIWTFLPGFSKAGFADRIVNLGYTAVSFFFLLSGYILAVVYLRDSEAISATAFFKARFARVYPLFLLTLVLDTPFLFWARLSKYGLKFAVLTTSATFAANCVMLQAWVPQLRGIDNPNWSLSVETLFYLSFPMIGVLLWRLRGPSFWIAVFALYLGGQLLVLAVSGHGQNPNVNVLPYLHLSTFSLGILLARWQSRLQRSRSQIAKSNRGIFALALFVSIVSLGAVAYLPIQSPDPSLCDGLLTPLFACLIFLFSHSDWLPAKLLGTRWLVVLGEASFGLYLFHLPVFHLFNLLHWTQMPVLYPAYLLISIAISQISFYYFETPARRWILKTGKRHVLVRESMEAASDAQ